MSIPKGLILYKTARHDPINFKYRHSSTSISLSTQLTKTNFQTKYHTGIVLNLSLKGGNKNLEMINTTSKLKGMKSCFIFFHQTAQSKDLAIKLIQRIFRTLKQLQRIEMWKLESLQKDPKIFKGLLYQRSLKFLAIPPLKCSEDPNELKAFLEFLRKAERRKCWPCLRYIETDFLFPEDYVENQGISVNVLEFLEVFKSLETLYKYLHFSLILPNDTTENPEENAALKEILKMQARITDISAYRADQISTIFETAEYSKALQRITLELNDKLEDYLDMSHLREFPALEEITLTINCNDEDDDEDPNVHFYYCALEEIKSIRNLKSLSLNFKGERGDVLSELPSTLSELPELTDLKLSFSELSTAFDKREWPWLKDIFQAIGKKKKLKDLTFDFKNPGRLFRSLSTCIGKLTQLLSLNLSIRDADSIKKKDVCTLTNHLSKLTMLESLSLRIVGSDFLTSTFVLLMDSIMRNFKVLSDLDLEFNTFNVTEECCQVIYAAIHQMKSLNKMRLVIGYDYEDEEGVDIESLDNEVRKRMDGMVFCLKVSDILG